MTNGAFRILPLPLPTEAGHTSVGLTQVAHPLYPLLGQVVQLFLVEPAPLSVVQLDLVEQVRTILGFGHC